MTDPRRHVLVTGASAGIGEAFAREYASRGRNLILVARREQRLAELATRLGTEFNVNVRTIRADLAQPEAPAEIKRVVDDAGLRVDVLVNNAGYGVPNAFMTSAWTVHRDTLQVMVTAVAELCHLFIPAMRECGGGAIINVASLAGHLPGTPGHTLYGAVKAWMIRFSESLAFELADDGIKVCALCPGFTHSEFHDVAGTREQVARLPAYMWMSSAEVARRGVDAVEAGECVYIVGRLNRLIALLGRYLPRRFVYWLLLRRAKDFRKMD